MQTLIRRIQRAYPQLWFACHVEHRTRGSGKPLTDRDVGILEHIDAAPRVRASDLAAHLGIGKSSLSAHLKRLTAQGLIAQSAGTDGRERRIALTPEAKQHLLESSALNAERLRALLATLTAEERRAAVSGLELLASAARKVAARGTGEAK